VHLKYLRTPGRKADVNRKRTEKGREITRLRATIADIISENRDIKKNLENARRGWYRDEITLI
jgi:hypothetical protein